MEEGNIKMKEVSTLHKQMECTFSRQGEIRTVYPRAGLLGVFANLRQTTISFVMSVRPFVRPSLCPIEQRGLHGTEFHEIWYFNLFRKSIEKIQMSFKPDKNNGYSA
jgi:hypothetical protein